MASKTHPVEENAGSLEHHFLIAMPQLRDPNFNGSVTYLWKHDQEGALGVVINRPARLSMTDLLDELKIEIDPTVAARLAGKKVMTGGPVESGKGFILHPAGHEWGYTMSVNDDVSITMSRDILQAIARGEGPEQYIVALGCAGWDAGQLDREIVENAWLTVPADPAILFSSDYGNIATAAAGILGVSLSQLSSLTGHS